MQKIVTLIILVISFTANCQNLADKIIVTKNLYLNQFNGFDSLYKTEKKIITNKGTLKKLLSELVKIDNKQLLLSKYKIDTTYIKNNYEILLNLYSNKQNIHWNIQQKQFIYTELQNILNYKQELEDYLSNGCCYTMHNSYGNEYIIETFKNNKLTNKYSSRKYVWGYKLPWIDNNGNTIFNYEIEKIINKSFKEKTKLKKPIEGNELLRYLVNNIIDNNIQKLYKLSAYTYLTEIEELKSKFDVLSFEEVYTRGRYIWDEPTTIKISLHNNEMFPYLYLQFLASKVGETIYSRDSIINNYKNIINRVQNIGFVKEYVSKQPNSKINVYYFNNKSINNYNIENVNKNPIEWKKQDEYIKSLKYLEKNNIKPNFDLTEAIKISERNHCGCNYRFEKNFIEKGIFFEIEDEENDTSIWVLLPDNTVLLYIMDGEKVLDLNLKGFENSWGIKFPCKLFNSEGFEIIR